jgi:K+-transporting ATPase KdpF subunit
VEDVIFVLCTLVFFALGIGYVWACEKLKYGARPMLGTILLLGVCALLLVYLLAALLWPEKF